jgi:hypothetical protein
MIMFLNFIYRELVIPIKISEYERARCICNLNHRRNKVVEQTNP